MNFEPLKITPVGFVRKEPETHIEILPEFWEATEGLREGDWVKLVLWFHESDTPARRKILKVHPYGNPKNRAHRRFCHSLALQAESGGALHRQDTPHQGGPALHRRD